MIKGKTNILVIKIYLQLFYRGFKKYQEKILFFVEKILYLNIIKMSYVNFKRKRDAQRKECK